MGLWKPLVLGLVGCLAASWVVRSLGRFPRRSPSAWPGVVGVGGGYALGHVVLAGWPAFPPHDSIQRLLYLNLAVVIVIVVGQILSRRGRLRWVLVGAGAVAMATFLLWPRMSSAWNWPQSNIWGAAVAGAGGAFGAILCRWLARGGGRVDVLILLAALLATGIAAAWSGSVMIGQLTVILGAAFTPALATGDGSRGFLRGGAVVVAVLLPALWLVAAVYGEMPGVCVLLLAGVPAVGLLVGSRRRLPQGPGTLVRVAAGLAPAVAALVLACMLRPRDGDGQEDGDWPASRTPSAADRASMRRREEFPISAQRTSAAGRVGR